MSAFLLVDDNPAHRMLARRALKKSFPNHDTHEAATVAEANELLSKQEIIMAVVDFNLDHESGLAIINHIRVTQNNQSLPILIISTSELPADIYASYRAGANCYLVKAADPGRFQSDLLSAVTFFGSGIE